MPYVIVIFSKKDGGIYGVYGPYRYEKDATDQVSKFYDPVWSKMFRFEVHELRVISTLQ